LASRRLALMVDRPRFFWLWVLVLFSLPLGFGLFAAWNPGGFSRLPWAPEVPFYFPFLTAVDQKGTAYVSDTATRRIVALNADGTLRWVRDGGRRANGFYYAHGLAVDSQDRLYVYNWVPLPGADYKAQEIQVQRYRADGSLDKTLVRLANTSGSDDFPQYFRFFVQGNRLFTLLADGATIRLESRNLEGGEGTLVRAVPEPADFVSIASTPEGKMAGAARDGSLWECGPGASWVPVTLPGMRKPWDVQYTSDGRLVVLDLLAGSVVRRNSDGSLTTLLSSAQTGGVFADTITLAPNGALAVADKDRQRLLVSAAPGSFQAYPGAVLSAQDRFLSWAFWTSLVLGAAGLVLGLFLVYREVFQRRLPLLFIQLLGSVPIIILAQVFAINGLYSTMAQRYRDQVRDSLMNAAHLASRLLPKDAVQALDVPSDLGSPAYKKLKDVAKAIQAQGEESGAFSYLAVYRRIGSLPYYVYTGSGTFGVDYPYPLLPQPARALFDHPGQTYAEYFDDYGVYDAAFASLGDGTSAGVIEVGLFADLQKDLDNASLATVIRAALVSGALFIAIFVLVTLLLLRSLNALRRMTREIAAGQKTLGRPLANRDETGQLSRDFETMSGRLQGYLRDITALTEASSRFVPRRFIDLLDVDDLTELHLGDQTKREMTVLFSTILNFRKVTSVLSPQATLRYLNSYLGTVVPRIEAHGGLIDKYIGDTYMALFPGSPSDALGAWCDLGKKMRTFNERRVRSGSEPLVVSFGLHRGPLMLGIVGEQERLEGTVIADSVNLTSRLNGLARIYGVPLVATAATLEGEPGPYRLLDHVAVKGKTEALLIAEPLDPEDPRTGPLVEVQELWAEAFAEWEAGRIARALDLWTALEARIPGDPVVRRHAQRCRDLVRGPLPDPWTPAIKVTEK
jgi:class 3 adenylate cyclase